MGGKAGTSSNNELQVTHSITFTLPTNWIPLEADRDALSGAGWREWQRRVESLGGEDTGFQWMDGLVDPKVQSLSEQALRTFAEDTSQSEKELEWPLPAIADAFEKAHEHGWKLVLAGSPEDGAIIWFVILGQKTFEEMNSMELAEQVCGLALMTPGDGCSNESKASDSYYETLYDLSDWTDWGFSAQQLRMYSRQGLAVFGVATDWEVLDKVFDNNIAIAK